MPAEQDDFWLIRPLICDFLIEEGKKCKIEENKSKICGISTCPFERGM